MGEVGSYKTNRSVSSRLPSLQAVLRQPEWPNNSLMALDDPKHHALCVTISTCGNYGLVGTRGGVIYKYNMQSGQPRGRYPKVDVAVKVVGNKARSQPGSVWSAYKAISGEEPKVVRGNEKTDHDIGGGLTGKNKKNHRHCSCYVPNKPARLQYSTFLVVVHDLVMSR